MGPERKIVVALLGRLPPRWATRKSLARMGFGVTKLPAGRPGTLTRVDVILASGSEWQDYKRGGYAGDISDVPVVLVTSEPAAGPPPGDEVHGVLTPDSPAADVACLLRAGGRFRRSLRKVNELERHSDRLGQAIRELTEALGKTHSALELSHAISAGGLEEHVFKSLTGAFSDVFDCCVWGMAYRHNSRLRVDAYAARRLPAKQMQSVVRRLRRAYSTHTGEDLRSLKTELVSHGGQSGKALASRGQGWLACPVIVGGRVWGTMFLFSTTVRKYQDKDRRIFSVLANQMAARMEHNRLFKVVKRLSITDELTGLYNRRHLAQIIESEFLRNIRVEGELALAMLDFDGFKDVNDTAGHAAGDAVLRKAGELFGKNVRRTDAVGRWGGDEFLFVLPNTGLAGARKLAEKIRRAVETQSFRFGGKRFKLTTSIGLAITDSVVDKDIEEALRRADGALYLAKKDGRNSVRVL